METKQSKNTTNKKHKQRLAFPVYDEEDIPKLGRYHRYTTASIRYNTS